MIQVIIKLFCGCSIENIAIHQPHARYCTVVPPKMLDIGKWVQLYAWLMMHRVTQLNQSTVHVYGSWNGSALLEVQDDDLNSTVGH